MAALQHTLVKKKNKKIEVQEVRLYKQITPVRLDPYETLKSFAKEPPEAVH